MQASRALQWGSAQNLPAPAKTNQRGGWREGLAHIPSCPTICLGCPRLLNGCWAWATTPLSPCHHNLHMPSFPRLCVQTGRPKQILLVTLCESSWRVQDITATHLDLYDPATAFALCSTAKVDAAHQPVHPAPSKYVCTSGPWSVRVSQMSGFCACVSSGHGSVASLHHISLSWLPPPGHGAVGNELPQPPSSGPPSWDPHSCPPSENSVEQSSTYYVGAGWQPVSPLLPGTAMDSPQEPALVPVRYVVGEPQTVCVH